MMSEENININQDTEQTAENTDETTADTEAVEEQSNAEEKTELEKAEESIANLSDRLMRTAAEFDNFKKRSAKEKDELYGNAVCDTAAKLLPVLDNLERAVASAEENSDIAAMLEGLSMIKKQFEDALSQIGIAPIPSVGEKFDPELHNAVMTEDSDKEENTVLEEFMKGYSYKNKIVRHSMVKVSN